MRGSMVSAWIPRGPEFNRTSYRLVPQANVGLSLLNIPVFGSGSMRQKCVQRKCDLDHYANVAETDRAG